MITIAGIWCGPWANWIKFETCIIHFLTKDMLPLLKKKKNAVVILCEFWSFMDMT